LGDCLLLAVFLTITEVAKLLFYFFPRKKLCINFDKLWFWLHFGRFFRNLIWSPCSALRKFECMTEGLFQAHMYMFFWEKLRQWFYLSKPRMGNIFKISFLCISPTNFISDPNLWMYTLPMHIGTYEKGKVISWALCQSLCTCLHVYLPAIEETEDMDREIECLGTCKVVAFKITTYLFVPTCSLL
jgi:hypothetical protein